MSEEINSTKSERQPPVSRVDDEMDEGTGGSDPNAATADAEVGDIEEQLAQCRAEVEEHKDLYLRTRAEMDNFRRRMQREKEELAKFANETILREVLPVIDNLQRAVAHARSSSEDNSATLIEGVEMTLKQFTGVMEKFNVTPVKAQGVLFDPACHEAMGQQEREDCPANTVIDVLQEGYMLSGRLLRPALVMVSKTPSIAVEDNDDSKE